LAKVSHVLSNAEVAAKLLETRTLMEMAGESFYKYTAYEKAAVSVENAAPLADLVAGGEHLKLPGIGKSIGVAVEQLLKTGTSEHLDELHKRFPPSILEVLSVDGIGVKTAAMLYERYGIASLAGLEAAIASNVLAEVPRLGSKTIENWKRGILAVQGRRRRTPLATALTVAYETMAYLREGPSIDRLTYAGSLRRQEVTVGDIDIVCTTDRAAETIAHFTAWSRAQAVLGAPESCIWKLAATLYRLARPQCENPRVCRAARTAR
jgi:DNA polymerase (family X)